MIRSLYFLPFLFLFSLTGWDPSQDCCAQTVVESSLLEKLGALPDAEIKKSRIRAHFEEAYEIHLAQPLDHKDPDAGAFRQRIHLSHVDFSKPVVMNTEGYAARGNAPHELSRILESNQIIVEHRYFGESRPETLEWKYLTVAQAAADHHRIIELFKKIYGGKWITTGISKGGQTCLIHRSFYPDDVDVTVPYVAPINFALEDPRIYTFLENVGDKKTRDRIKQYQVLVLKHRKELLPMLKAYAESKNHVFSIGLEVAFEYSAVEYPFAYWQYGNSEPDSIPKQGASAQEIFDHLVKVVPFYLYADSGIRYFEPFFYQACTELGYYGFETSHLEGLLEAVPHPTNTLFAPKGVEVKFNPMAMKRVNDFLQERGNNIIYIYGETDTWTATGVMLSGKTNALKIVKKGGSHNTRINNLPDAQREKVLKALEKWLEIRIAR